MPKPSPALRLQHPPRRLHSARFLMATSLIPKKKPPTGDKPMTTRRVLAAGGLMQKRRQSLPALRRCQRLPLLPPNRESAHHETSFQIECAGSRSFRISFAVSSPSSVALGAKAIAPGTPNPCSSGEILQFKMYLRHNDLVQIHIYNVIGQYQAFLPYDPELNGALQSVSA